MFVRSTEDRRRVVIVDFSPLAYIYAYGGSSALSATVNVGGTPTTVDTTIPAYTIKALHRWSNYGANPLAVCFDGKGSARSRKAYFAKHTGVKANGEPQGYKASRDKADTRLYEGISLTANLLIKGGVSCYKAEMYEADDLIKACVDRAKIDYPNLPIDIITGDHDLLPLVDDQVSVFLRSRTTTYAEEKEIEKPHYVQITPRNYESYLSGLTAYKTIDVPYNSVLLAKLLRGDKSDEIAGKPDWKPKEYKLLLKILNDRGYDIGDLCRYGSPIETVVYKSTNQPIPEELIDSVDPAEKSIVYSEPAELTRLCEVLSTIVEPEDIDHIRFVYNGINLNRAFTGLPEGFNRRPAKLSTPIKGYQAGLLQKEVCLLNINLPQSK